MVHGPNAWNDLLKMQAKIRKERQEQLYAQQELRKNVMNVVGVIVLSVVFVTAVVAMIWLVMQKPTAS